jgi:hypothetical protein
MSPHDLDAPRNQAEPLVHENYVLLATEVSWFWPKDRLIVIP